MAAQSRFLGGLLAIILASGAQSFAQQAVVIDGNVSADQSLKGCPGGIVANKSENNLITRNSVPCVNLNEEHGDIVTHNVTGAVVTGVSVATHMRDFPNPIISNYSKTQLQSETAAMTAEMRKVENSPICDFESVFARSPPSTIPESAYHDWMGQQTVELLRRQKACDVEFNRRFRYRALELRYEIMLRLKQHPSELPEAPNGGLLVTLVFGSVLGSRSISDTADYLDDLAAQLQ